MTRYALRHHPDDAYARDEEQGNIVVTYDAPYLCDGYFVVQILNIGATDDDYWYLDPMTLEQECALARGDLQQPAPEGAP